MPVRSLWRRSDVRRVSEHLEAIRPDLLHTHLGYADVLGGLAARGLTLPSVSTIHADWWGDSNRDRVKARADGARPPPLRGEGDRRLRERTADLSRASVGPSRASRRGAKRHRRRAPAWLGSRPARRARDRSRRGTSGMVSRLGLRRGTTWLWPRWSRAATPSRPPAAHRGRRRLEAPDRARRRDARRGRHRGWPPRRRDAGARRGRSVAPSVSLRRIPNLPAGGDGCVCARAGQRRRRHRRDRGRRGDGHSGARRRRRPKTWHGSSGGWPPTRLFGGDWPVRAASAT